MFRLDKAPKTPITLIDKDKNGNYKRVIVVDQFPAQDFNLGANGFPANDITLLMRATTDKEFAMIAARLQESKITNPNTKGMSDKEILKTIIPNWVQSASEVEKFMDWYNRVNPVAHKLDASVDDKPAPTINFETPAPTE